MAKKSRTPRPPRPVQAPKRRVDSGRGISRRLVAIIVGAALLVAAIVAGVVLASRGGGSDATASGVCQPVKTFPQQRRTHVQKLPAGFKYNSFPPTSGPHNPTPAIWNIYTEPVPELNLVHNLEHGGVVIQYGKSVPRSDVDGLLDWYRKDPNGLVIAPLPALGDKISIAAWSAKVNLQTGAVTDQRAHLAKCTSFNSKAFDTFANAYGFQGPEYHPRPTLVPGS